MNYDNYLAQQVEDYMNRIYCEPKIVRVEKEYEGNGDYSENRIYNCEECENQECEHWRKYND